MPLLSPIIHCLIDAEPTRFHDSDVEGSTTTFAANLSFEVPANREGITEDQSKVDESNARGLLAGILDKLDSVEFHAYLLEGPSGGPYTLSLAADMIMAQVSAPNLEADKGHVLAWLEQQRPSEQTYYWSSLDAGLTSPEQELDAEGAGASPRLRAAQAWNAPVGHRQGLTHLLRITPIVGDGTSKIYVVLPYLGAPDGTLPENVTIIPPASPTGDPVVDWAASAIECTYDVLGGVDVWRCRTNAIGIIDGKPTTMPPPTPPVDDTLTADGFLVVNPDAENIRRYLKTFEQRAASILMAANALHVDGKEDAKQLEPYFGIKRGTAPGTYTWGSAVWYVLSRLVSALDNHVLALLKPIAADSDKGWKHNSESEGDVLAPLVSLILEEMDDLDISGDARQITDAIRKVLSDHCPLVAGGPAGLLVPALRYIHGIKVLEANAGAVKFDKADITHLISSMLAQYQKGGDYNPVADEAKDAIPPLLNKSIEMLAAALLDLEQPLFDEAGAEQALIRLFETVGLDQNTTDLTAVLTSRIAENIAGGEPGGALRTAVDSAWANYKALLSGNFNGAEAIRRSVSASFTDALLKKASVVKEKLTALRLRGLTAAARFYKWRFAAVMNDPNCFEVMALPLVKVDDTHRPKAISMLERLDEAYARAVEVLVRSPKGAGRFKPDSFPQPLPIQIAAGIDGSDIDDFAKAFNGICVAIRRDEADGKWAYANLADLSWREKDDDKGKPVIQKKVSTALHPMLPAVADGRGPMFIDYEGFPFAEAADAERFADDVASTSQMLFYRHEPHDGTGAGFEKLPRLAYGRRFQSFGFAVSNAGVLPRMLQRNPTEPWMPLADIEQLFAEPKTEPPLFEIDYQRRTAIARMAVIEMPGPGKARRLGESIAGVQPLSIDYPRIGMVAEKGLPGIIDLFKESDGVPRMHLPEKITRPIEWQLSDLEWFGKPSSLTLGLFDHDPDAPDASGEFPTSITADLTDLRQIRLIVEDDGEARTLRIMSDKARLNEHNLKQEEASYWLRLELTTDQMDRASLSFADPEGKRPAGEAAPLILLQPEDERSKTWRTDLPKAISLRVSTPRVGYLDFTRWMANSRLRGEAYSEGGEVFELALLTAYYMRHLDPLLAQHLDNLPDPAVEAIRIELMQTDQLTARGKGPFATRVDLATPGTNLLADFVKELGKDVAKDPEWTPVRLRKLVFEKLDEIFSFRIDITAGATLALTDARVATISAGAVAHLSMHTFVSDEHFVDKDGPAVFHAGLKQYATRQTVKQAKDKDKPEIKWLCFPAASICIETMHDGIGLRTATEWVNAADAMIEAVPASVSRRFDLKTLDHIQSPAKRDDWRLISEIDVTTQRWRPTGRPIYHFIRPRMNPLDDANPSSGPVVPVATNDEVAQFENEAFFDRPDIDAQTVTQRLAPLGARTVLQDHPWDAPSATYFRHRFTLRSRYAGALQSASKRSVDAWPRNQKAKGWTKRVAMLADMSRLILTRPQLRALIPLTTAPGGETATAPVPPVAAILQEPPYSRGGLADRIAPELKTGFGYGFAVKGKDIGENDPPLVVEILDSRKEAGPSPQLSYRPFEINDVLGLSLSGEGPLGLTFDMPDAPAPAFANSMMSLRPISLTGSEPPLEEALMGVAMRRYLDPSWLAGQELASKKLDDGSFTLELPTERTWWIDVEQRRTAIACTWESGEVLQVSNIYEDEDASHIEVKVSKKTIDGVAGRDEPEVTIARVQTRRVAGLIVLHQPIAMGRYSTSILAKSASVRVADGVGALPLMLASFEWSIPAPKRDDEEAKPHGEPRLTISGGRATARETAASATTSLRWTQISRDFEFIRTFGDEQSHLARNLVARIATNAISFDLINGARNVAVSPSTFTNPYPSHVHRHIGLITSRYLPELGRPVEEFCRRALAAGPRTMLAGATKGTEQAVRVVEFETPAMIVGDNRLALPGTYRQGYFDLVSTGYSPNSDLILTIRFVGTETHLGKFKKLTVMLDQPSREQSGVRAPIEIGIDLPKGPLAVGVRLILRPAGTANWAEPWLIQADGSLARSKLVPKPANPTLPLDFSGIHPGFMLELKADTQAGIHAEFWADISLLHLSEEATKAAASVAAAVAAGPPPIAPPAVEFDFGWLFASDGPSEPAALVSPAGLATMKEAQARIISVSPPIPIV